MRALHITNIRVQCIESDASSSFPIFLFSLCQDTCFPLIRDRVAESEDSTSPIHPSDAHLPRPATPLHPLVGLATGRARPAAEFNGRLATKMRL